MATTLLTWICSILWKIIKYFYSDPKPELAQLEPEQELELVPQSESEPEPDSEPERVPTPTSHSSSFPLFQTFPTELQLMIWEAALEINEVGICIPIVKTQHSKEVAVIDSDSDSHNKKPEEFDQNTLDAMLQPLIVNCKLHVIFHVCGQSRYIARKRVSHREDDIGACYGAFRNYDPRRDIFFVTPRFCNEFPLKYWTKASEIKHIGLEFPHNQVKWWYFIVAFWYFIEHRDIRNLTIIKLHITDPDTEPSNQTFQLNNIVTEGWEVMTRALRLWLWGYSHQNMTLPELPALDNNQFEVMVGTLALSGSEPAK
ncbi:hypothetical protein F4781DRAFT_367690 [Annulohypoxylon bovei var. microspora]|nr:hypothetical protein F4781DRAFT_367690 [Annulohypoxylon bovei var. microspora]